MSERDIQALMAKYEAAVVKRLTKAAAFVANEVKRVLSVPAPRRVSRKTGRPYAATPATPGAPPRKITGRLRASVAYRVDPAAKTATVGVSAAYGSFLEQGTRKMRPHPYLGVTYDRLRGRVKAILEGRA